MKLYICNQACILQPSSRQTNEQRGVLSSFIQSHSMFADSNTKENKERWQLITIQ